MKCFLFLTALGVGVFSGAAAWSSNEVWGPVYIAGIGALILCAIRPESSLLYILIISACIPVYYLLSNALGFPSPYPPEPNVLASVVVVVPTSLAGLVGYGFSKFTTSLFHLRNK